MPPFEVADINALKQLEGQELPPTDWFVLSQERIQRFADAIEDRQWIHVDKDRASRESPYGGTIAHGFLTLSLISHFSAQSIRVNRGVGMRINYGLNRVRFPSAVRSGSAIRARFTVALVRETPEFVDVVFSVTVECQGAEKPCCIAEWIVRYYRA